MTLRPPVYPRPPSRLNSRSRSGRTRTFCQTREVLRPGQAEHILSSSHGVTHGDDGVAVKPVVPVQTSLSRGEAVGPEVPTRPASSRWADGSGAVQRRDLVAGLTGHHVAAQLEAR